MHPTAARVTVFLVDDDHSALDSLGNLLRSVGYTTKAYSAPKAFLDEHDPSVHGCVVLDLAMTLNGFDVQQELAKRAIDRPIIFLTGKESVPASVEALKGGAVDFLIKPHKETELLDAVKAAVKRDSDRLHSLAIARRVDRLSLRERQVLALVVRGMSNKNIAAALGVREISVTVNRERAMKKMGSKNIAEVVRMTSKMFCD
jgi:FixJ family two-component response regulator